MMRPIAIGLAIFVSLSGIARSQTNVIAAPAAVPAPAVTGAVHPGTALLDSMGIDAGATVAVPTVDGTAEGTVQPGALKQ